MAGDILRGGGSVRLIRAAKIRRKWQRLYKKTPQTTNSHIHSTSAMGKTRYGSGRGCALCGDACALGFCNSCRNGNQRRPHKNDRSQQARCSTPWHAGDKSLIFTDKSRWLVMRKYIYRQRTKGTGTAVDSGGNRVNVGDG